MKKLIICLLTTLLSITACTLEKEPDGDSLSLVDIRINDEIQGWQDISSAYAPFHDFDGLFAIINGGADEYFDLGLLEGFRQKMSGSSGVEFSGLVMDFGSAANSRAMFDQKKDEAANKRPVSDFDQNTAIAKIALSGGATIYSNFNRYYFEFDLTGYEEIDQALSDGALFLNFYKSKF